MPRRFAILLLVTLLALIRATGTAQEPDARTVLQAALKAMGGENLRTIQYSGTSGYVSSVGQNYSPAHDWPANQLTAYTRTINYDARSSREEYVLRSGTGAGGPIGGGNAPLITTPFEGEQRRHFVVSGNYAWNIDGTAPLPQPALAEVRQLDIWLTPHGCLKGALAPGANPIAAERNEQGKGRIVGVSWVALGKYRVQCGINSKNLVERVQTWLPNPVVGDLYHEIVYTAYKDFGGLMFPTNLHAHHDLDDDLEGGGVNVSGGHNSFGLTVSSVQANVTAAAPAVPDAVRTATVPPVRVESQKIGNGVWYVGGGTHASVAVEFRDHVTVVEAPLNEARSLAVIAEVKTLIPNKPIRTLVSTHHHWDHIGGLRAYVARENLTIVMHQSNQPYYAEVLWIRPWILQPDRLSLFPPEEVSEGYTLETVGQKHVLSDGTRTMEIYNVQGLAHAQGMVMAYLPQDRIIIEADLFTPPTPNAAVPATISASNRTFYDNIQRLKLDVATIAPIHGGRTYPWADFAKFVTTSKYFHVGRTFRSAKEISMRIALAVLSIVLALAASASSQEKPQNINSDPKAAYFLSAREIAARRAKLGDVAYANVTVVERVDERTATGVAYRLAVDRRRPPQNAAAHAVEAEIWAVVDGSGEVTTGGKMIETRNGATVTRRIEGGTVHKVSKGDFLLIPEGVPHQVTGFSPELYMVTFEFPRGSK